MSIPSLTPQPRLLASFSQMARGISIAAILIGGPVFVDGWSEAEQ
jgi:hypothetical protein